MNRSFTLLLALIACLLVSTPPSFATPEMDRANELYAKGQFQAASDAYIDAICAQPRSYAAHYQLANTLMKLGKLGEAQTEYEMCLDLYPDAMTKSRCHKALKYLTGHNVAAAPSSTEGVSALDQALQAEGDRRATTQALKAAREKEQINRNAEQQSKRAQDNAKAQIEQMKQNSAWYTYNHEAGIVPLLPAGVEDAVINAGNARAESIKEKAKKKASEVQSTGAADVTDGLRSQLRNQGNASVRLSPVGTNVYVRNYQSTGKVAASGDGTR